MSTVQKHLLFFSTLLMIACGGNDEEKKEELKPLVGSFDIPLSLRSDAAPAGKLLELAPTELRYEGKVVAPLAGGRFAKSELGADRSIPKLAALVGGEAVSLRAHSMVRHSALMNLLRTLKAKNVRTIYLHTNTKGAIGTIAAIRLDNFSTLPRKSDAPKDLYTLNWADVKKNWDTLETACQSGFSVNCDSKPKRIAEGGKALVTVFGQDNAARLIFSRFEQKSPEEEVAEEDIDEKAKHELFENKPPATTATFTWTADATVASPSPLSEALRPFCSAESCAVLLSIGRDDTVTRTLATLGAAFPNGTPSPQVTFFEH